jgi:TPR repeat protein
LRLGSSANNLMARKILALIDEALAPGSNVVSGSSASLDAGSYHNLGLSFLLGTRPDFTQAGKWFRKAAEMGDPQAQFVLGMLYWSGRGVEPDAKTAANWLRKAAENGDAAAMRVLGTAYNRGTGVERNPKQALRWIGRAAEAGDAEAQAALGKVHFEGIVVARNLAEALHWLTLAVQPRTEPAAAWVGETDGADALRQAPHLLKEAELFATPEEKAKAKARAEQRNAKSTD